MFLLVSSRQICALQWDIKYGVSVQSFISFGKILSQVSVVYEISHRHDSLHIYRLKNGFGFYF